MARMRKIQRPISYLLEGLEPRTLLSATFDDSTAQHALILTFDHDVSTRLTTEGISLMSLSTHRQIPPPQMSLSFDGTGQTATLTFPGVSVSGFPSGVLPEGNYDAVVSHEQLDTAQDQSNQFGFLDADFNNDGKVNALDFNALATNFGATGATYTQGDSNYDGVINTADFTALAMRFNTVRTASPPSIDLDLFEDANGDHIHDNSDAAEQLEQTQATPFPLEEQDGDYAELALIVTNADPAATVTFNYSQSQVQLYEDVMGLIAVNPGVAVPISDLGIVSSATVPLFLKLTADQTSSDGVQVVLNNPGGIHPLDGGGSATTQGFGGGTTRQTGGSGRADDPAWHDDMPDSGSTIDNNGGLDDGDGPAGDLLTDRDGFWTDPQRGQGKHTLMIGFAGHTQSLGFDKDAKKGRIWEVRDDPGPNQTGIRVLTQKIKDMQGNFAVTLFPEDPGNDSTAETSLCGDGVLGVQNPHHGGARVDAQGNADGALAFLIDAIKNHGVDHVGLFGYSHGGGSVQLLIRALAQRASNDSALFDKLFDGLNQPKVNFFWTAYIDAVHIDSNSDVTDANGTPNGEDKFPIAQVNGTAEPPMLGSQWHESIRENAAIPPFRDGSVVSGADLNPDDWTNAGRSVDHLRQVIAEEQDPRWPNGTDHTNRNGHGIAEDTAVQNDVLDSLFNHALIETF